MEGKNCSSSSCILSRHFGSQPDYKDQMLPFNRTQSGVVIGHPAGHNILKRLSGLTNSPLCRCGAEEETSGHTLCECEALPSLRHTHLGSFFLYLEDIKIISLGTIWNFKSGTGLLWPIVRLWGTKGPF